MARYPAKQKCQLRGVLYCYYLLDIVITTLFNGRLNNKNTTISKNSKQSKSGNNNKKKLLLLEQMYSLKTWLDKFCGKKSKETLLHFLKSWLDAY